MNRQQFPVFLLISYFLKGCCGPQCQFDRMLNEQNGDGGGRDAILTDLPFAAGYKTQCVQGANGSYSHEFNSTRYDLDLDTPNNRSDPVFSPADGRAYVLNDGAHTGFGTHVNVDLGDGTYLLMGHLKQAFVPSGSAVAKGQLLGFEGSTGNSQGDHVHFGRHSGLASKSASQGTSFDGLRLSALDISTDNDSTFLTTEAVCGLSSGHVYESELEVAHWHPPGSLVKTPDKSTVYLVTAGNELQPFQSEDAFLSRGYDFREVALVTDEELDCYDQGPSISSHSHVRAVKDSAGTAWLLIGELTDSARFRQRVPELGAAGLLQSYGIIAYGFDDIDRGNDSEIRSYPDNGQATYRDGALLETVEEEANFIIGDGLAMEVAEPQVLNLMGWGSRRAIPVNEDELLAISTGVGNCLTDTYCMKREDVTKCGGNAEGAEHVEEDSGLSGDADTGDDTASAVEGKTLSVYWTTPGNVRADWLTLAGTYLTAATGTSTSWNPVLAEGHNATSVVYSHSGARSGDHFRFSGAYGLGNDESWTCLAPFPPGTVQGTVRAKLGGIDIPFRTTADPDSNGCQLELDVP